MTDQKTTISNIISLGYEKNHLTIDFRATGSIRKVWLAKNLADGKDLRNKFGLQKFG